MHYVIYYQSSKDSPGLLQERTRLTKINADRKQLMLAKERGELINTEKAMLAWGYVTKNKDNKLSAMPRKGAPLLYGLNMPEIEAKLTQIIDEVRNEISNPNLNQLKREWEIVRVSVPKGKVKKARP